MKVSILTPVYNTNHDYLREMIESVIKQTFGDFEFIILNDSPNNFFVDAIIKEYSANDRRIKYFVNADNLGISASRNKLLNLANGQYIAILDHDDVSDSRRIEKQVAYLDAHPEIGVVGTQVKILGSDKVTNFPRDNIEIKKAMINNCVVSHSSAMIRRSVMVLHNIKWREEYSPAEDYMLWAELMEHTLFHNLSEPLLSWRVYAESSGARASDKMSDAAMRVRSYLMNKYPSLRNRTRWVRLFGGLPLIKIYERGAGDTRYMLFGKFPILAIR